MSHTEDLSKALDELMATQGSSRREALFGYGRQKGLKRPSKNYWQREEWAHNDVC